MLGPPLAFKVELLESLPSRGELRAYTLPAVVGAKHPLDHAAVCVVVAVEEERFEFHTIGGGVVGDEPWRALLDGAYAAAVMPDRIGTSLRAFADLVPAGTRVPLARLTGDAGRDAARVVAALTADAKR